MENLIAILLAVVIIGGLMLLFNVYTKFLAKLSTKQLQKKLQKKIESGKINDNKLVKLYNSYKKQKDNKLLAIFMAGIFYKSYMKIPEAAFDLYKQEMIKRNLPLE